MKPVSIQPMSALAGAGLLGLVLIAAGAVQTAGGVHPIPVTPLGILQIAGIPDPRDMLVITESAPFIVPPDKVLAVTALGAGNGGITQVTVRIDGEDQCEAAVRMPYGNGTTMSDLPPGLTAHAGARVEVVPAGGPSVSTLWGYLVDAAPHTPHVLRIAGVPDPRDMLVIRESEPFVVPTGKLLTITGLGGLTNGVLTQLVVNGVVELSAISNWSLGNTCSVSPVPKGLTVRAGSTITLSSGSAGDGRAWGYLVDE